jgi:hypothetical protein
MTDEDGAAKKAAPSLLRPTLPVSPDSSVKATPTHLSTDATGNSGKQAAASRQPLSAQQTTGPANQPDAKAPCGGLARPATRSMDPTQPAHGSTSVSKKAYSSGSSRASCTSPHAAVQLVQTADVLAAKLAHASSAASAGGSRPSAAAPSLRALAQTIMAAHEYRRACHVASASCSCFCRPTAAPLPYGPDSLAPASPAVQANQRLKRGSPRVPQPA